MIVKNEKGFHDFFYNRVMFPLTDMNNQVIGYSGRLFDGSDGPKYVNSREHPLFKKVSLFIIITAVKMNVEAKMWL